MSDIGERLVNDVEQDGYFVARNYFPTARIQQVRRELDEILEQDQAARQARNIPSRWAENGLMISALSPLMHTVYFPLWKSTGLRELADALFSDPEIRHFCRRVIGEHFRLRVDLVRKSTGVNDTVNDFQLPHVWHRDTPGEFTFGIFFDDLTSPYSGGTAVVPGTHWQAYHPLWDFALSSGSYISKTHYLDKKIQPRVIDSALDKFMFCNGRMRGNIARRATEIRGKPGDIYFFLNDIWHGRAPNVHGSRNIMVRIGGFATEFEFKDDMGMPDNLEILPASVAVRYNREQIANSDHSTLMQRIAQRKRGPGLPECAAREKQLAGWLSARMYKGAPTR